MAWLNCRVALVWNHSGMASLPGFWSLRLAPWLAKRGEFCLYIRAKLGAADRKRTLASSRSLTLSNIALDTAETIHPARAVSIIQEPRSPGAQEPKTPLATTSPLSLIGEPERPKLRSAGAQRKLIPG
ncbi:hypothetical protein EMPG_12500 [Blastomyces silverae]|uniref:Uncharacterized protein n=1 Tax=Blastomyces silverae TaxID=2060906 RepID=A0A0H1BMY3_9EURO|nr:hypothetical protein EMPG_12500 [Blastomyces silverae]